MRGDTRGGTAKNLVMRLFARGFVVGTSICACLGCEKKPPPSERRTEPWPAPAAASTPRAERGGLQHEFLLEPSQRLSFELKTKNQSIAGEFPVLKGSLKVDLMNLKHTDGKLEIDLGATRITTGSEDETLGRSMQARNWLGVGASVPEADREALRWASFLLEEVRDAKVTSAHEASVDRKATRDGPDQTIKRSPHRTP